MRCHNCGRFVRSDNDSVIIVTNRFTSNERRHICNRCMRDYYIRCSCGCVVDLRASAGCSCGESGASLFHGTASDNDGFNRHLSDIPDMVYGVELEYNGPSTIDMMYNRTLKKLYNQGKVCIKGECTTNHTGIEIITLPLTLEEHKDFGWPEIMDMLRTAGFSDDYDRIGMHVHINKKPLSGTNILKLGTFIYRYYRFWGAIGRRSIDTYSPASNPRTVIRKHLDKILLGGKPTSRGRKAVHFGETSIEMRFPKTTLDPDVVIGTVDLLDAASKFTGKHGATFINGGPALKKFLIFLRSDPKWKTGAKIARDLS